MVRTHRLQLMTPIKTCRCRLCGGVARFLYSNRRKVGRLRRYGCLEPDCGVRWSERDGDQGWHECSTCVHWLADRCGLGFPEPLLDPTFASLCTVRLERGSRLDPADAEQ